VLVANLLSIYFFPAFPSFPLYFRILPFGSGSRSTGKWSGSAELVLFQGGVYFNENLFF
jgi:hypothetical protein